MPSPATANPLRFDNSYARDLQGHYALWQPEPAPAPRLLCLNRALADELGLDADMLASPDGIDLLAGNRLPPGAEPLAQAYAGHQFGHFSPRLGDGRALLIGELIDRHGQRRDLVLKGSGRTPFSRNGDGKYALGPALREYLIGEAMAAHGIPTSRALAVVASGEQVWRQHALPGAILTRVAASHIRIGTFEYLAAHHGPDSVRRLAKHVIARHYPALHDAANPWLELLRAVADRQAALVARWLGVGFIHGVMNTDNMAISGETIDYGPCAFIESYAPDAVFSSIDRDGRYAYGQQAEIAQWNLARLAETLLPLIDTEQKRAVQAAIRVIEEFPGVHRGYWLSMMRDKLGLDTQGRADDDRQLADDWFALLQRRQLDFTNAFRHLYDAACASGIERDQPPASLAASDDNEFAAWWQRWRNRQMQRDEILLARMCQANPWLIPRNHRVEAVLEAAQTGDLAPYNDLLERLRAPATEQPTATDDARPAPAAFTATYRTFCGT